MGRKAEVNVSLSVVVDVEDWYLTYGSEPSIADLRHAVREYVIEQVRGSAAAEECGLTVRLSARQNPAAHRR